MSEREKEVAAVLERIIAEMQVLIDGLADESVRPLLGDLDEDVRKMEWARGLQAWARARLAELRR